jgi:alkanesulfonate monooxygenase SsuD/methylene tetrahydromethanopterin reductase-like flavin-dependent oxidoreductase (luciferase family)
MGLISNSIEIGTAVIDMLYESSLYMAEDAGAADLIAGRGALPRNRISEET